MNLREILLALGGKENKDTIIFQNNSKLDLYPVRFTDDGMGYGINKEWITSVDLNKQYINIFTDKEWPKENIRQRIEEDKKLAEEIIKKYATYNNK